MRWTYPFTGEVVEKEKWCWTAIYDDGKLEQFDDLGVFHRVGEIDMKRLLAFRMSTASERFEILVPKGAKLIFRYENYVLDDGKERFKVYCFGYENDEHKVWCILPNGSVVTD